MNIVDIIAKKRDGLAISRDEIKFFIDNYVSGEIKDYQASALLMAIYINGMNHEETIALTESMLNSGERFDLSSIPGVKVDKHSTGGVGDKTSMVLGPIVASCGAKLAKMSGRGLGFTGGTLDKLESIPKMRIDLTKEQFIKQVKDIGIAIMGQTGNVVPADKKLYALRDVTATVGVLPLIASSIMSKKLASGADTILLDVKVGSGAYMKTMEDAKALASLLVNIGNSFGKDTRAVITNMAEPLGFAVGNNLEVIESINTLQGKGPRDFTKLCKTCASIMLNQAHICKSEDEAYKLIEAKIKSGEAFEKFRQFVKAQGGDLSYIDNPDKFKKTKTCISIKSISNGYIEEIDSLAIGKAAMLLGAGRKRKEDSIDHSAGILLTKKVGDKVSVGEELAKIYTNKTEYREVVADVYGAYKLVHKPISELKIIEDYIK